MLKAEGQVLFRYNNCIIQMLRRRKFLFFIFLSNLNNVCACNLIVCELVYERGKKHANTMF